MKETRYGFGVELALDFESALQKTTESLKEQGFGVLTEIDVKETLKKKLDVDFKRYYILGACNPPLAHKALSTEEEIGLLLPCNVIVYEAGDNRSRVVALDPLPAMSIVGNPALEPIAREARDRLKAALANLSRTPAEKG